MKLTVACVQMNCQNDMAANIARAVGYVAEAAQKGADLIALPENAVFMSAGGEELQANSYPMDSHPAIDAFCSAAKDLKKWILIGSLAVRVSHSDKVANRSVLIDDRGEIVTHYDKIHLYNASVQGGETHQESKRFIAGDKSVVAELPWCKLGLTICYDLRFPQLFRSLAKAGAEVITAPAAFTEFTGNLHWHTLLRARAIENGCYIMAPAQTGQHPSGRRTYGHSLIVDPWGTVIGEAGDGEGVVLATIDTDLVAQVRQQIPSLEHDREFGF